MNLLRYTSLLFFFLTICTISIAQVSFVASTDAKQVVENGYFQITFTLNNAKGSNFKAPSFKRFKVLNGPSRSMSTTIINGNASQKISYSYSLQPNKVGKFTIAPATIVVNGKTIKSNAVKVDVIKASAANKDAAAEQQLFVKAEIDTNLVYVGQQLVVDYKIRRFDSRAVREVVDGVQYTTKVLKRIAIFPQQTGLQTIAPMTVRLGVITGNKRPNSFFFSNQIKPVNVQTNPLDINVKSLPTPVPPSFSGAVGKYAMNSFVDKTNITTDDAISLKLTIQGNGDIKRLQPPTIAFPGVFEVYEPKVLDEVSQENSGVLRGQKTIEYLAIPKQRGQYQLKPSFTYFDTDSAKFITLVPNIFNLNIRQGKGTPTSQLPVTPDVVNRDIRYIKTATTFSSKGTPFPKTNLFYSLLFLPFLLLGGAFAYKRFLAKNGNIDIALLKSRRAQKVATKRLATANEFLQANKSRAFYDEISRALLGYVCDKLSIPLSELTKDNVRQKLQTLKVQEQHITDYMSIIKITEMALFAGMDNSASMQETYQKSVKVISEIEAELT